jgi:hypothetical protein
VNIPVIRSGKELMNDGLAVSTPKRSSAIVVTYKELAAAEK